MRYLDQSSVHHKRNEATQNISGTLSSRLTKTGNTTGRYDLRSPIPVDSSIFRLYDWPLMVKVTGVISFII